MQMRWNLAYGCNSLGSLFCYIVFFFFVFLFLFSFPLLIERHQSHTFDKLTQISSLPNSLNVFYFYCCSLFLFKLRVSIDRPSLVGLLRSLLYQVVFFLFLSYFCSLFLSKMRVGINPPPSMNLLGSLLYQIKIISKIFNI